MQRVMPVLWHRLCGWGALGDSLAEVAFVSVELENDLLHLLRQGITVGHVFAVVYACTQSQMFMCVDSYAIFVWLRNHDIIFIVGSFLK